MSIKPRTRRFNRNYEAILDTARKIIAEMGVENLSVRLLADALHYSPSALYKYFDNRDALIGAVAHQGLDELENTLQTAFDSTSDYKDKARATGRAYLEFARANPNLYLVIFNGPIYPSDEGVTAQASQNSAFGVMIRLFEEGIAAGAFAAREDYGAMEMAFHAWVTVHGIVMLRATGTAPQPMFDTLAERILDELIDNLTA